MSRVQPGGEPWNAQNEQYRPFIEYYANLHGVPDQLLRNLARLESDWNPNLQSTTSSATGMFQFIGRPGDRSRWSEMGQLPAQPDREHWAGGPLSQRHRPPAVW